MELIKLPMNLGLTVAKILKNYNIEPRKNERGILSLEFTQEELDLIKELSIVNPTKGCIDGIENLRCLDKLSISTHGYTAYIKDAISITDKDITKISKLRNLKFLEIDNQSSIYSVDLDELQNLEEIKITRNTTLEEINGLGKLEHVKEFIEYGNKELFTIDDIEKFINNNELDTIELDVLHYNEIIGNANKLNQIINCDFSESISGNKTVSYSYYQMLLFHKKCLEIANEAKKISQDIRTQIIFVENYLAKNISYDYDALDSKKRAHFEDGKQKGRSYGTNSAYNGIMFGSAVCEGYTRSMQYILKLMGIKTKNVHCIGGADKIRINESYHNQVTLPDDGYHSIIRVDDNNSIYYCDPCWDSCRFHAGDQSLPYCLLTKKEMSKSHTLSFEEDNIIYDIPYPRDYVSGTIQYINKNYNYVDETSVNKTK